MPKHFLKGLILFLVLPYWGIGQECFDYHKTSCTPAKSKYTYDYNINSVSFLFKAGEIREVPLELYAGKDYRITLCSSDVFNKVIYFSIIKSDGSVLYDNSRFDFELNVEFASQQTQEVIIHVQIPDMESTDEEGCVGILIEDMVSVRTGF